jgi:hypothetical protein
VTGISVDIDSNGLLLLILGRFALSAKLAPWVSKPTTSFYNILCARPNITRREHEGGNQYRKESRSL